MFQIIIYPILLLATLFLTPSEPKDLICRYIDTDAHLIFAIPIDLNGNLENDSTYEENSHNGEFIYKEKPEITVRFILTPKLDEYCYPLVFRYDRIIKSKAFNVGMDLNNLEIRDLKFPLDLNSSGTSKEDKKNLIIELQELLEKCFVEKECSSDKIINILEKAEVVNATEFSARVEGNKNRNEEAAILVGQMLTNGKVSDNNVLTFRQIMNPVGNNPSYLAYKASLTVGGVKENGLEVNEISISIAEGPESEFNGNPKVKEWESVGGFIEGEELKEVYKHLEELKISK